MQNRNIVRRIAIKEARELLETDFVVVDTETTGLGPDAEIVEISIIDRDGTDLFTSLVRPNVPITPELTAIHGIDNDMVRNAPCWKDIHDCVMHLLTNKKIAIYNAPYDLRMLQQCSDFAGCRLPDLARQSKCIMNIYSKYVGEWSDHHGNWRWHKLSNAAQACGVDATGAHRALADTRMTLGVIRYIAAQEI
ncbi:MAG: 3'-5' exonuclease [Desulfomicrobium apsheronum]|nr:3'-5' exonuclease [Desulfomicrobium apsheronum]